MIVFADPDCMRPEHIVEIYKTFGGGQRDAGQDGSLRPTTRLAILPNTTHYNILANTAVADATNGFLADLKSAAK